MPGRLKRLLCACVKYSVVAISCLICLVGVGVVGVGIWLRADATFHQFVDVDNEFNFIFSAGYVTLCVGVVIAAVGALGVCGATNDNVCILVTFFVSLVVTLVFLFIAIAFTVWTLVQRTALSNAFAGALRQLIDNYYTDRPSANLMNAVQSTWRCCGAENGISDYVVSSGRTSHPGVCQLEFYGTPCHRQLMSYVQSQVGPFAAVASSATFIVILAMTLSALHVLTNLARRRTVTSADARNGHVTCDVSKMDAVE